MESRLFRFTIFCACGACILTGILSGLMLGWMSGGGGNAVLRDDEARLPVAQAAGIDRSDNVITCTGPVEQGVEAVYILDCNTGMLSANVLSKSLKGFQARYLANVTKDLSGQVKRMGAAASGSKKRDAAATGSMIEMPQIPKYVMTTVMHDFTGRMGNATPAAAAVCVTEINTGLSLVYIIQWNRQAHTTNAPIALPLTPLFADRVFQPQKEEEEL